MKPELYDRMRAYIAEQTALPTETIEAVLDAQVRFWEAVPDALSQALDMLDE